jgi:hypothetical protein
MDFQAWRQQAVASKRNFRLLALNVRPPLTIEHALSLASHSASVMLPSRLCAIRSRTQDSGLSLAVQAQATTPNASQRNGFRVGE